MNTKRLQTTKKLKNFKLEKQIHAYTKNTTNHEIIVR